MRKQLTPESNHYVKSVRIRSFSGPYLPALELEYLSIKYEVSLHIQSECGKIRTRKTPYLGRFHTVTYQGTYVSRKMKDAQSRMLAALIEE